MQYYKDEQGVVHPVGRFAIQMGVDCGGRREPFLPTIRGRGAFLFVISMIQTSSARMVVTKGEFLLNVV